MADPLDQFQRTRQIHDLDPEPAPSREDELEVQKAGGGASKKVLLGDLLDYNPGTGDHREMFHRNDADQHTIASITGLAIALNTKSDDYHVHNEADITDLDKYTQAEVDAKFANNPSGHIHTADQVTYDNTASGLTALQVQDALDELRTLTGVANHDELNNLGLANQHPVLSIIGLQAALDAKSDGTHTHSEAEITGLDKYTQAQVDAFLLLKAAVSHVHTLFDITDARAMAAVDDVPNDGLKYLRSFGVWLPETAALPATTSVQPTSFTVDTADGYDHWYSISAAGVTGTIPPGLPLHHRFSFRCKSDTIIDAAGVTAHLPQNRDLAPLDNNARVGFVMVGSNEMDVYGDLVVTDTSGAALEFASLHTGPTVDTGIGGLTTSFTVSQYVKNDSTGFYEEFATNTPLWLNGWLYLRQGMENVLSYSDDFSQWAETGLPVITKDIVGLTGAANTGSTVTDNTTVTDYTLIMRGSIPADTNTNVARMWIKKDSDESRFPLIYLSNDWATARLMVSLNTKTGASALVDDIGTNRYEVIDDGDWWIVMLEVLNNSIVANNALRFEPASSATLGGARTRAVTGSCGVGEGELILNTTLEEVRKQGPLFNGASTLPTDDTLVSFDIANHGDTGCYYMETTSTGAQNVLDGFLSIIGSNFQLADGTNTVTKGWVEDSVHKVGIAFAESLMAISVDGIWSGDVAYDGDLLSGALDLFRGIAFPAQIRSLDRYSTTTLQAAKDKVDEIQAGELSLVSAVISQGQPNIVLLTFSDAIIADNYIYGMTATVDDGSGPVDLPVTLGRKADSTTEVFLFIKRSAQTGQSILLSYVSTAGSYQSVGGNPLDSFTGHSVVNGAVTYPWMETQLHDYQALVGNTIDFPDVKAPKTFHAEGGQSTIGIPAATWFKYDVHAAQATGTNTFDNITKAAVTAGITCKFFRMLTPHHMFEYDNPLNYGKWQGHGMPVADFGPATIAPRIYDNNPTGMKGDPGNSTFYQGHWVYAPGADVVSTTGLGAVGGTVTIDAADVSKFIVGDYIGIRPSLTNFNNSDNRRVLSIVGNVLTLDAPWHCTGYTYSAGAYIAPHMCEGDASSNLATDGAVHWLINMSSVCPVDGGVNNVPEDPYIPNRPGKRINELEADFLNEHLYYNHLGTYRDVTYSGLHWDVDREFFLESKNTNDRYPDYDNDGVADNGKSIAGENWVGIGWNQFYQRCRDHFPTFPIVGGTAHAQDKFDIWQGTQEESWLTGFNGNSPSYGGISSWIHNYNIRCHYQHTPVMEHALQKQGTVINPTRGETNPNSIFRIGLSGILMNNGWYHHQNTDAWYDCWYDEYAVDVNPGSGTYGTAYVNDGTDEANQLLIRDNQGWLGDPVSNYYRIYDTAFADANNVIVNGDFATGITGWTADNTAATEWAEGEGVGGSNALRWIQPTTYKDDIWDVHLLGESVPVTNGTYVVMCFTMKTQLGQGNRRIGFNFAGHSSTLLITEDYLKYAVTFKPNITGSVQIKMNMGQYLGDVYFDEIKFFTGRAEVLRRDYENGIALLNATNSPATVPLETTYQRIEGLQDNAINDGTDEVGSVSVPAYDGIILVRKDQT